MKRWAELVNHEELDENPRAVIPKVLQVDNQQLKGDSTRVSVGVTKIRGSQYVNGVKENLLGLEGENWNVGLASPI